MKSAGIVAGLGVLGTLTLLGMPLPLDGNHAAAIPERVLRWLVLVQPLMLVGLAAWAGGRFAPRLGLATPLIDAALSRKSILPIAIRQLKAAVPAAILLTVLEAAWLQVALSHLPEHFIAEARKHETPLLVRIGYGGLSEEVLMRWGFMSSIAYAVWKVRPNRRELPTVGVFSIAIFVSSLLFGLGHLPMAVHLAGSADAWLSSYVIAGNMMFGIAAGWLFWRFGLEAAMLAHVLVHVVAAAASQAGLFAM